MKKHLFFSFLFPHRTAILKGGTRRQAAIKHLAALANTLAHSSLLITHSVGGREEGEMGQEKGGCARELRSQPALGETSGATFKRRASRKASPLSSCTNRYFFSSIFLSSFSLSSCSCCLHPTCCKKKKERTSVFFRYSVLCHYCVLTLPMFSLLSV